MTLEQPPLRKSFDYLEAEPAPDAPFSDNPSGLYCSACRETGMSHCSSPEYCGYMRRMRPLPSATDESHESQTQS